MWLYYFRFWSGISDGHTPDAYRTPDGSVVVNNAIDLYKHSKSTSGCTTKSYVKDCLLKSKFLCQSRPGMTRTLLLHGD
jgi:hypothetical protein